MLKSTNIDRKKKKKKKKKFSIFIFYIQERINDCRFKRSSFRKVNLVSEKMFLKKKKKHQLSFIFFSFFLNFLKKKKIKNR